MCVRLSVCLPVCLFVRLVACSKVEGLASGASGGQKRPGGLDKVPEGPGGKYKTAEFALGKLVPGARTTRCDNKRPGGSGQGGSG